MMGSDGFLWANNHRDSLDNRRVGSPVMNDTTVRMGASARAGSWAVIAALLVGACAQDTALGGDAGPPFGGSGGDGDGGGTDAGPPPPTPTTFTVALVPSGVTGVQRVNLAVPLAAGTLTDETAVRVLAAGVELPAARRALARFDDGSARSIQLQVDVDVTAVASLTIELGAPGQVGPALVDVSTLLAGTGAAITPRVWAVLPADVLIASEVAGALAPRAPLAGTTLDAWTSICDYDRWDTDAFLVNASASRDVWLYDRVTAMYRGYAITGDLSPLRSAYREAALYQRGMTIANGTATGIAVPDAATDLKYHYSQGVALHYLLTGDDRFREAAEAISKRVAGMWDPAYDGTDEFWTERHAGFALLAHEWARLVTDDQAAAIDARADAAVTAYLAVQAADRFGQTGADARCFAHTAGAHAEPYGGAGCSPWMSALLAEALDTHARRVGGARATAVRRSLVQLGRSVARSGRDGSGRPLYWMGTGASPDEADDYDEHWGEAAYVVALAWSAGGRADAALRQVADELVTGLGAHGEVGQVRSFNWQCRAAVMTPALLQ